MGVSLLITLYMGIDSVLSPNKAKAACREQNVTHVE